MSWTKINAINGPTLRQPYFPIVVQIVTGDENWYTNMKRLWSWEDAANNSQRQAKLDLIPKILCFVYGGIVRV